MGRFGTSREQAVYELEESFESRNRGLAEDLARGRLGFLEFQRARADLEKQYYLSLDRILNATFTF